MIDLIDISSVSIVFVNLMSLTSSLVSRQIYDDVKLLIEELNQHAESEKLLELCLESNHTAAR